MTRLAHGAHGTLAATPGAALTAAAVAPVLACYPGLGTVNRVAWHSPRPFAASGIVRCAGGDVFVKRHDPRVRGVTDLREEHDFAAHLRRRGVPVPHVLAAMDGATGRVADDGVYEVHELGQGGDAYRQAASWTPVLGTADARALGRALARLHRAAAGHDAPARRTRLLVAGDWLLRAADPAMALDAWMATDAPLRAALAGRPWQADFARVLAPFHAAVPIPQEPLWGHGDFHTSNTLWQAGCVSAVLDFGMCNRLSAGWDLATAIERNAIAWLRGSGDIGRLRFAHALLAGYAEVAPVPAGVPAILPLVHVEFALSELAYFHAITRSPADADAAYHNFLLGHAAWFAGPHGRAFLDGLAIG